jgi:beta-lactamase superfamily II metal-dependent hydrolase
MAKPAVSKTKTPSKKSPGGKNPSSLRVRMYRVGFGDFFLVTVPSSDGPQHIVIDCGVTKGTTGKGDIASIKWAVRHMADETNGKLTLIIVTHRHQDHIIGFSRCATEFEKFKVDAIWMPYWETEYAADVHKLQDDLQGIALDLRAAALAGDANADMDEILGIVENATGISKEGPGGGTNAQSLDLLKNRLGVKPDYYYKGQKPKLPAGLVTAGLSAEILGPPPADALAFVKLKDLKKGVGQYLDAGASNGDKKKVKIKPFGPEFVATAADYPPNVFREWAPRTPGSLPDFTKRYPEALEKAVKGAVPASLLLAAKTLDGILNNQSLVVLFTWKDKTLLFAGDAQAGNWEYWLYALDKPKSDPTAEALSKEGQDILGSLDFYKVGHHGSTNATPISAVGAMGKGFVAMCSTQEDSFGSIKNKSEVPRIPLLEALAKKSGALVRSDQIAATVDGKTIPAVPHSPAKPPQPKSGKFEIGECYLDYLL